ncbi:MAG: serine/threonine protein kinase [Anaerolineae bacterium]|nr:MAG: serine/threonine protein kinase [Anaerolineae bacterium]
MSAEENQFADLTGKTLAGYTIVEKIGKGGMATVYKAFQPSLSRDVAIKVLSPYYAEMDSSFRPRFAREAQAVASLRHPNILLVIDYGEQDGFGYLVMEYVPAGTLKDLLDVKSLPLRQTSTLIGQVAGALDHAHERGIIHRDVKPSNVLLPKPDWALLTDFGLARMMAGDSGLTQSGLTVGTPAYMSPEQGSGHPVDRRSDIYSLGVMLYEMVVGRLPYTAETPMAVVVKHIVDPLPVIHDSLEDFPDELEEIILKAIAKDPAERYASAGELAEHLKDVTQHHPDWMPPEPAARRFDKSTRILPGESKRTAPAATRRAAAAAKPAEKPASNSGAALPVLGGLVGAVVGVILFSVVAAAAFFGYRAYQTANAPTATPTPSLTPTQTLTPTATLPPSPTVAPTLTPAPPLPQGTILFEDDFSDPTSGWDISGDRTGSSDYSENGTYNIAVFDNEYVWWANPYLDFDDVVVEVDASLVDGTVDNGFGIICSYLDADNFFYGSISSEGFYSFWQQDAGEWVDLGDGEELSPLIPSDGSTVRIRLECVGDTMTLYVNNVLIDSIDGVPLTGGDVGLVAETYTSGAIEIEFDNFVVFSP